MLEPARPTHSSRLPTFVATALIASMVLCLSLIVIHLRTWRTSAPSELLVFTELGRFAAGDRFQIIDRRGRTVKAPLPFPEGTTIQSASCASLSSTWVVLIHNIIKREPDKLYSYLPGTKTLSLLPTGEGFDGHAVISPSGRLVAYTHAPLDQPSAYALWVMDLGKQQSRQISRVPVGTWDSVPSWSPNEAGIAFIRISRTSKGAMSWPMLLDLDTNETKEILDAEEGVSGVAFGGSVSHLAILTKRGVELFDLVSAERRVIMPSSRLEGWGWRLGGIAMSKEDKNVVVAVFDRKAWRSELWSISTDGKSSAQPIYEVRDATIETPSFVPNMKKR
jgi:hypothetical protein